MSPQTQQLSLQFSISCFPVTVTGNNKRRPTALKNQKYNIKKLHLVFEMQKIPPTIIAFSVTILNVQKGRERGLILTSQEDEQIVFTGHLMNMLSVGIPTGHPSPACHNFHSPG